MVGSRLIHPPGSAEFPRVCGAALQLIFGAAAQTTQPIFPDPLDLAHAKVSMIFFSSAPLPSFFLPHFFLGTAFASATFFLSAWRLLSVLRFKALLLESEPLESLVPDSGHPELPFFPIFPIGNTLLDLPSRTLNNMTSNTSSAGALHRAVRAVLASAEPREVGSLLAALGSPFAPTSSLGSPLAKMANLLGSVPH